jgi:DNA-binding transcriptional LysR family regulator
MFTPDLGRNVPVNVTLRQLRAFVAVADLGRFGLASAELNLTQSAVSILVRELETELKHRLFDRHTRMVSLTAAGREFLPQARKILEDLEIAVGNIHELAELKRGRVAIASAIVLAATVLPPAIARFREFHPDVTVQVRDMPEEEIRPALKRNEVDLGIGTISSDDSEIEATLYMRDRLTLICRSDHPFVQQGRVRWRDLAGENLIGLAKDNPLRDLVDRALLAVGRDVRPRYEVRFSTTAISMIAAGLGVAVLPQNSRLLSPRVDVVTVDLIDPPITRDVSVLELRQRALSPAAARMKEFLLASVREQAGETA